MVPSAPQSAEFVQSQVEVRRHVTPNLFHQRFQSLNSNFVQGLQKNVYTKVENLHILFLCLHYLIIQ